MSRRGGAVDLASVARVIHRQVAERPVSVADATACKRLSVVMICHVDASRVLWTRLARHKGARLRQASSTPGYVCIQHSHSPLLTHPRSRKAAENDGRNILTKFFSRTAGMRIDVRALRLPSSFFESDFSADRKRLAASKKKWMRHDLISTVIIGHCQYVVFIAGSASDCSCLDTEVIGPLVCSSVVHDGCCSRYAQFKRPTPIAPAIIPRSRLYLGTGLQTGAQAPKAASSPISRATIARRSTGCFQYPVQHPRPFQSTLQATHTQLPCPK